MKLGFEFFGCVEHDSLFTEAFPDKVLVQLAPRANPYQTPAREPRLHCRQSLTSLSPWLSVIPRHHPITIAPTPRFPYPSFASIRKLDHAGLTGATPCRSICKDPNPTHQIGISSPASPRDSNTGGCTLRLAAPAASYPPLSYWARPRGGAAAWRGFVFMPLKDIVDYVYSVYFYVVPNQADAPIECAVVREPWRDDADSPPAPRASAELARRVLGSKGGQWGQIKGFGFEPQGVLKTPWGRGKWGVLPERPGVIFADFGGGKHELLFDAWPAFVSTRCSDGEIVKGKLLV